MTQKEKLTTIVDVAFNNSVDKRLKVSYNGTIDVQFGIYLDTNHMTGALEGLGNQCRSLGRQRRAACRLPQRVGEIPSGVSGLPGR